MEKMENLNYIKNRIVTKKKLYPYLARKEEILNVITDMDHTPYSRFFRGSYKCSEPIIFEREAGWRPLKNELYEDIRFYKEEPVNICFEYPCTTTLRCLDKKEKNEPEICDHFYER